MGLSIYGGSNLQCPSTERREISSEYYLLNAFEVIALAIHVPERGPGIIWRHRICQSVTGSAILQEQRRLVRRRIKIN
jgi:hypothetical protein